MSHISIKGRESEADKQIAARREVPFMDGQEVSSELLTFAFF